MKDRESLTRFLRILVAFLFIVIAFWIFAPSRVPRLSMSGFLGFINTGIIIYLLILSVRHFLFLYFSAREEIRRDSVPDVDHYPGISIIVPGYNEEVVIAKTIETLDQLDYPEFEVLVVDDGSTDATYARALEAANGRSRIRVLTKSNGGKARASNFAIEQAKYDLVFCMDADSLPQPRALREGVKHLRDPDVVAVAGSVLVLNQKNAVTRFQTLEYLTGLNFYKSAQSFFGLVTIIPGPSGLFRKDVILRMGGYHADTFAEDCDLTLRILMDGGRVVYEPLMEVRTEVPETLLAVIKQRYRWNRGILQATLKHITKLRRWREEPVAFFLIGYFMAETLVLPTLNLAVAALTLIYQIASADLSLFSLWLVQLTILDMSVVVMTLWDTRWPIRLLLYSVINRFTYAFFQDIVKLFSLFEEVVGIRMNWGKLERVGGGEGDK